MITKLMGALLFLAGLIMLLIAMLALLGLSQPSGLLSDAYRDGYRRRGCCSLL